MRWSVLVAVTATAWTAPIFGDASTCACPPTTSSSSSPLSSPASSLSSASSDLSTPSSDPSQPTSTSTPSSTPSSPPSAKTVGSTVLIVARDDSEVKTASPLLDGYGIPWQSVIIPQSGAALPALNTSLTDGVFGSIIMASGIVYEYSGSYKSALTAAQWQQLYDYQTTFRVRMVRFNEYPGAAFGATPVDPSNPGCCTDDVPQSVSLVDVTSIHSANLKPNAPLSMKGLYHYPAKITDPSTTMFAAFEPNSRFPARSAAAVINTFQGSGLDSSSRQQMVWFAALAPEWSLTSVFLQHASIHWMTRGLFSGKRKVHLSPQIDDMQIPTALFYPAGTKFKINTTDLDAHVSWQAQINTHLPAGSDFRLEIGHNGNGNLIDATETPDGKAKCNPNRAVVFPMPPATPIEFKKPLGSGTNNWPDSLQTYSWSKDCTDLGNFTAWFRNPDNLNAFSHVSHTFSHEELNNATYADALRETQFNQAWMKQVGIDQAARFSPSALIPPAITGVKNGDAIRAWADSGVRFIVGDNTRPTLRNSKSKYWPLATTMDVNGFDGMWIVPRYTTTIYFNCDQPECILKEWKVIAGRDGSFSDLLDDARLTNTHYIMSLSADPFMFHQANMRQSDMPVTTVGSQTGKMSLVMSWIETVTQELTRLTNWPVTSLKHDDLGKYFLDRMALDNCQPTAKFVLSDDGKSVTQVVVGAAGNTCSVPVPVTIPQGEARGDAVDMDVVGSEPPIAWVTLDGSPVTVTLSSPVLL